MRGRRADAAQRTEGTQRGTHLRKVQEEGCLPENPPGGDLVDPLLLVLVILVVAMIVEMFSVRGGAGEAGWVRQHEGLHHAALDEVHLSHGTPRRWRAGKRHQYRGEGQLCKDADTQVAGSSSGGGGGGSKGE